MPANQHHLQSSSKLDSKGTLSNIDSIQKSMDDIPNKFQLKPIKFNMGSSSLKSYFTKKKVRENLKNNTFSTMNTLFTLTDHEKTNSPWALSKKAWIIVLSYLNPVELAQISPVCKYFNELSLTPDLWKMYCMNEKINCGPGIEHLLIKCGGDKGLWWKTIYIEGRVGRENWTSGRYKKCQIPLIDHSDAITSFKFDVDKLVIATKRSHLILFETGIIGDFLTPMEPPVINFSGVHKSAILTLDFSTPVGSLLASGDSTGTLAVWNIFTGELLAKFKKAHAGGISTVLVMDDQFIITCGFDRIVRIFTLSATTESTSMLQHTTSQKRLFNSPKSSQSSQTDAYKHKKPEKKKRGVLTRMFDKKNTSIDPISTLTLLKELIGHKGEIFSMHLLPDEKLATGSTDSTIKVNIN
jgi:WD40 repeat protein